MGKRKPMNARLVVASNVEQVKPRFYGQVSKFLDDLNMRSKWTKECHT